MTGKCWCDCEQRIVDPTMCGGCEDEDDLRTEVIITGAALDRLRTEGAQDAHDRAGDALDAFRDIQRREPSG